MTTKQRPDVDTRMYDAAEIVLNTSDVFQALREDIQEDCIYELAHRFQREWEAYCEEEKF
jgi:hypothetical protein